MNYYPAYENVFLPRIAAPRLSSMESAGIAYGCVTPVHRQGVLDVLTRAFVNEPSTAGQSIGRPSYAQWRRFTDLYMDECTTNGLSVVALDGRDGETVAGAFINRDFLTPPDPRFLEFLDDPSPFGPIARALEIIDEAWFARHPEIPRTQAGRVADLWMVGVHPRYRGLGIAAELARRSLDRVARAGFEYAIVECTGAFSQRAMEAAGCTSVFELPYADFLWKGKPVFGNVPPPHIKWVIYEKKLN